MRIGTSSIVLWAAYFAFAIFAVVTNMQDSTFHFTGLLGGIKAMVWLALLAFLGYSIYCTFKENFFRSVRSVAALYWGRQIGTDLYLGLFVSLIVIFLNDGAWVVLIWLLPTLIYANLTILLYVALHFDEIAYKLLGV